MTGNELADPARMIRVICAAQSCVGVRGEPLALEEFLRWPGYPKGQQWRPSRRAARGRQRRPVTEQEAARGVIAHWVINMVPSPNKVMTDEVPGGMKIVCPRCHYQVPVTWKRLAPILDLLVEHDVPAISIQALKVRLR